MYARLEGTAAIFADRYIILLQSIKRNQIPQYYESRDQIRNIDILFIEKRTVSHAGATTIFPQEEIVLSYGVCGAAKKWVHEFGGLE